MFFDLAFVSGALIVIGVMIYVILDGFDLGVGILFPFAKSREQRDRMINTIAPFWDGNETWLILGGAVLFAAFPAAYAIALPAFYIPIFLLLFALVFRGVAFEFRIKANRSKRIWSAAFFVGSFLAAFTQGMLLGGVIEGIQVTNFRFSGGAFDWLSPFSIVTGFALVAGYALLGAGWLVMKSTGSVQEQARRYGQIALALVLLFMLAISILTPYYHEAVYQRWFLNWERFLLLSPIPLAGLISAFFIWCGFRKRAQEKSAFFWSIILFLTNYIGLVISLWPYVIPPSLTIWDIAAPFSSQVFTLIVVALTLPMVIGYTIYAYYVFRGKIDQANHYE